MSITRELWSKVEDIFHRALEHDDAGRSEFLQRACAGNDALLREVESLLSSHDLRGDFIGATVRGEAGLLANVPGTRIGPWRLTGLIGEGGMGSVYAAVRDDDEFRKEAAIKIVKAGMDTAAVLERFRHERQILAGLEHPNIARLLDGGATEDGRPWFAMERIEGRSIVAYCAAKNLSIADRLHLFLEVCSAVRYAHRNLIVHRDIKPGNILITSEGIPKLLDFGIARVLDPSAPDPSMPDTLTPAQAATRTLTVMRMLTPDYASPEQVLGAPVTTSTDVYSLGAVLYELLSGRKPHRITGYSTGEIERVVCNTDPEKPSLAAPQIRRKLSGDLDNIVLMAMRREPERRYSSVEQFAEDIRRNLDGLPVIARPDTLSYRAGKFVQRYRAGVIAASLVLLSLSLGVITSTYQARRAERRFNQVRGLAHAVLFDIYDQIETLPGSTKARKLVVDTGLKYFDSLAQEARGDRSLLNELGGAYSRIADVQGHVLSSSLGATASALTSYQKARDIFVELGKQEPANLEFKEHLATIQAKIADQQSYMGDMTDALASYRNAASLENELIAAHPTAEPPRHDLASLQFYIARSLTSLGDYSDAMEGALKGTAIHAELLKRHPQTGDSENRKLRKELSADHASMGRIMARQRNFEGALEEYRRGVAILEKLVEDSPGDPNVQRSLTRAYGHVGDTLGNPTVPNLGDVDGAREAYRKMMAVAERLMKQDPADKLAATDYATGLMRVGGCTADYATALAILRKALAILSKSSAEDPTNIPLRSRVALVYFDIGARQLSHGESALALRSYRDGLADAGNLGDDLDIALAVASAWREEGRALASEGRRSEALDVGRQAIRFAEKLGQKDAGTRIAEAYGSLATTMSESGDVVEGCKLARRSAEEWEKLKSGGGLAPSETPGADRAASISAHCAP